MPPLFYAPDIAVLSDGIPASVVEVVSPADLKPCRRQTCRHRSKSGKPLLRCVFLELLKSKIVEDGENFSHGVTLFTTIWRTICRTRRDTSS
jgi:hypothetical protein